MKIIKASEFNEEDKGYVLYLSRAELLVLDNMAQRVLFSSVKGPGNENTIESIKDWRHKLQGAGMFRHWNYFTSSGQCSEQADKYVAKEPFNVGT